MKTTLPTLTLVLTLQSSFLLGQSLNEIHPSTQFGIVDCFGQRNVRTADVRGIVVDPTGTPVPNAEILMSEDGVPKMRAISDSQGRFRLNVPAGTYIFKVEFEPFAGPEIGLDVGRDLTNFFRPEEMKVLLGIRGSFCPWVTTNDRKFTHEIAQNRKQLEESAKQNATQK